MKEVVQMWFFRWSVPSECTLTASVQAHPWKLDQESKKQWPTGSRRRRRRLRRRRGGRRRNKIRDESAKEQTERWCAEREDPQSSFLSSSLSKEVFFFPLWNIFFLCLGWLRSAKSGENTANLLQVLLLRQFNRGALCSAQKAAYKWGRE